MYLVPNNLTEDEEFLTNDLVPFILNALRKRGNHITNLPFIQVQTYNLI